MPKPDWLRTQYEEEKVQATNDFNIKRVLTGKLFGSEESVIEKIKEEK